MISRICLDDLHTSPYSTGIEAVIPLHSHDHPEALAVLESRPVLECKKRDVNTPEVRAALNLLDPHIQPAWLIPQYRHSLDGEETTEYSTREGQQQVFRVTFPGIRNSVRALIGKRADALARKFH